MVLFHKFFLLNNKSNFDWKLVAATSLFIAVKTNQGFLSVDKFVNVIFEKFYKNLQENLKNTNNLDKVERENYDKVDNENRDFQNSLKENILTLEVKILIKIGFDLEIILPYKYLENFFEYLRRNLKDNIRIFLQTTTNFINDSFKIPLCLFYDPKLVALTSILLTAKLFNISLPEENGVKWHNLVDKTVKFENLLQIASLLNNMYSIISSPKSKEISSNSNPEIKMINKKDVCGKNKHSSSKLKK